MNNTIKFSILIPVYNTERYLKECVESVLSQTYQHFEIVIIDDGSTDGSGIICDEYEKKDARIEVYHQVNQGQIMARRNAIAKAKGDFYLFLDSDDYWDCNLLEVINQTINKHDCDLVIYRHKMVSKNGTLIYKSKSDFKDKAVFTLENKEELFRVILNGSELNTLCSKAVRADIIDSADYSKHINVRQGEDLLQSLPLLYNAKRIVYIDKAMYNYRRLPTGMSSKFNIDYLTSVSVVRSVVLQYLKKLNLDSGENLKLFYNFYFSSVLGYIMNVTNSDNTRIRKIELLKSIKKIQLYIDSLKYINWSGFSWDKRILLMLFQNDNYDLLLVYLNFIVFLRKLKPIFLNIMNKVKEHWGSV